MSQFFDLLGDPIPEGWGKRGRPAHVATDEKRRLVKQLLAFEWTLERIAAALSITPPTLRKNYFRELKFKAEARARVEAKLLDALMAQVEAGNVAAMKEYNRLLEKHDLRHLAEAVANRGHAEPRATRLGKKEQQSEAAKAVGGKFAPPPPPGFVN